MDGSLFTGLRSTFLDKLHQAESGGAACIDNHQMTIAPGMEQASKGSKPTASHISVEPIEEIFNLRLEGRRIDECAGVTWIRT